MTGFSGLVEALRPDLERVGRMMDDVLRSDVDLLERTNASIRSHPGKMLRPMLSIMAARLCTGGKPTEDAFRLATASELVHNATLLHDDVVDGSASRRGRPTVSALLGGRAAVLLGDFWLVRAVGLLLDVRNHMDDCLRLFSKTLSDLAEGEMIQLQKASAGDTTEEDYLRIIYSKTASLFETAVLSSARSQEASPAQYEALKASEPRNELFKAFKEHKVIYCNMKQQAYYEISPVQPDVLLKDFVAIFHPELIEPSYQPTYYSLLK